MLRYVVSIGLGLALALPRIALPCCERGAADSSRPERNQIGCDCCAGGDTEAPAVDAHGDAPGKPVGAAGDPAKCTTCVASCCVKTVAGVPPAAVAPATGARTLRVPADDLPRSATIRGVFHPPRR